MPKFPTLTFREVIRLLSKAGFVFIRQKGSHRIFLKGNLRVVVPIHSNRDLKRKTLKAILESARIPIESIEMKES